ncbi:hypothetical protein NBRC116495_19570 [Aurantivibrio plasticivorans]
MRVLIHCLIIVVSSISCCFADNGSVANDLQTRFERLDFEQDYEGLRSLAEQQLTLSPNNPELERWLAIAYFRSGETMRAIELLSQSLSRAPDVIDNHYAIGVFAVRRAGEVGITHIRKYLSLAQTHFNHCIELAPDHALARFYLVRIYQNAPELMGDERDLVNTLQNQLRPLDNTLFQISKAYEHIEAKDYTQASRLLDHLSPLQSGDTEAPYRSLIAYTNAELALNQKDTDKVVVNATIFIDNNSRWSDMPDVDGHIFIGQAHALAGDKKAAAESYQQAKHLAQNKRLINRIERLERKLQPPKIKK